MNEFDDLAQRLRDERPALTSLELDDVKQRVRTRAARQTGKGSQSVKSRIAVLATLVAGLLLSTTGGALAVSGLTQGDSASVAQYGTPTPTPTPTPGAKQHNQPQGNVLGNSNASKGPSSTPTTPTAEVAQPTRQVEVGASGNELPFTGFAAIPVLIAGAALLATGLMLRRRQSGDR